MNTPKTPLGGRPISPKEAFKGLGHPKTWKEFSEAVYADFRAKPKIVRPSHSLVGAIEKVKKVLRPVASHAPAPVYARRLKRKPAKKPAKTPPRKVRSRKRK